MVPALANSRVCNELFLPFQAYHGGLYSASFLPPLCRFLLELKNRRALNRYARNPTPIIPPNAIKRLVILENFVRTGQEIFVETGTYYGETTRLLATVAKKVYTVELSLQHHQASRRITAARNVEMTLGDSRAFLTGSRPSCAGKSASSSMHTPPMPRPLPTGVIDIPIMEELRIVNTNPETSLIIIDDAIGGEGYPSIEAVRKSRKIAAIALAYPTI